MAKMVTRSVVVSQHYPWGKSISEVDFQRHVKAIMRMAGGKYKVLLPHYIKSRQKAAVQHNGEAELHAELQGAWTEVMKLSQALLDQERLVEERDNTIQQLNKIIEGQSNAIKAMEAEKREAVAHTLNRQVEKRRGLFSWRK